MMKQNIQLTILTLALTIFAGCSNEKTTAPVEAVTSGPDEAVTTSTATDTIEQPASNGVQDRLAGTWRDTTDPFSLVDFQGTTVTFRYDEESYTSTQEMQLVFVKSCDELKPAPASDFFILTDESDDEPLCYRLLEATENSLSYSYVARGNTLTFEPAR